MIEMDISMAQNWFAEIKCAIDDKYHISDPIFIINSKPYDLDLIIQWCHKVLCQERWVLYKHLGNNVFELKSFYPNSPDEACKKTLSEFFDTLHKPYFLSFHPNFITLESEGRVFYQLGNTVYTRKQIEMELFYHLKTGSSEIIVAGSVEPDPNPMKKRLIITVGTQGNEMYHRITSGLLNLEYKD